MKYRLIISILVIFWSSYAYGKPPNVVLILVDDLGYGDLACYGGEDLRTPHLDGLMSRGMRFDQFYANCTVCSPTRASLLTGRYPDIAGVPGVIRQWPTDSWGYLRPDVTTLPQQLQVAGYHTGMVGKWHLGFEPPNIPTRRGFQFFHGFLGDMMDDYWTHLRGGKNWMRRNETVIDPEGHATDLFTEWSVDYINQQSQNEQPFFLYLAYNAPHFPIQPPPEWLERVKRREPQLTEARAKNVAFIEHLDDGIGKVLHALRESGVEDETIVIFSSDNGGSLPHSQSNGNLRGGKQDHWEGGIRVPTCIVWPGKIPARRTNEVAMTMDLMPTLCEIAGVESEPDLDGRSFADVLLRNGRSDPERVMVWVRREGNQRYQGRAYYAIRRGDWKLQQSTPFAPMVMVNLADDPREQSPAPARGDTAKALTRELMDHLQRAGSVPWQAQE